MGEESILKITRIFDAPRELVYDCWTQGRMMQGWSCPEGFEIIFGEADLVVGGKYRSTMKSDQYSGTVAGEYKVLERPSKLVMTHGWEDDEGKVTTSTLITVEFIEIDGKTQMNFTQSGFDSVESRDGHSQGWNSSFEKLEKYILRTVK